MNNLQRLERIESDTMSQLKDFQCATVERIDQLFRNGQHRVLVADEVGLGKTLIARGSIAKAVKAQYEQSDKLFKIIYICSNQAIAKQNIQKLDVFGLRPADDPSGSRLSMQHLIIAEQEHDAITREALAQLIPLTPSTSFSMTSGGGTKEERALMYVILRRLKSLKQYSEELSQFMSRDVLGWEWIVNGFEQRVSRLEEEGSDYLSNMLSSIKTLDAQNKCIARLKKHIKEIINDYEPSEYWKSILRDLRMMFAEISVGMLQPDLAIMDEFQRFRYLIESEDEDNEVTESSVIVKRFFETKELKVLLLSATPYKLYSTMEELEETNNPNEYYEEFLQVLEFLFNDKTKYNCFERVWSNYSVALREIVQGDSAILQLKNESEDEMYSVMCRTERLSVMDAGDYTDDSSSKNTLSITSGDIHTYLDFARLLVDIGEERNLLVDYAKSSPYLLSFMNHYQVKSRLEKYFLQNPEEVIKTKNRYLWVDKKRINKYGVLPSNNVRLEDLKCRIFNNQSELYMWVPPSKPYYNLEGVYRNSQGFSKILVFSSWEMVPKMIGSLISYEAERRTVGVLSNADEVKSTHNTYFSEAKLRYPPARLRFNVSNDEPRGMYLLCLMYPSDTLAEVYHPIECMNRGLTLKEIRKEVTAKIRTLVYPFIKKFARNTAREDKKWYYVAPALLDGSEYYNRWIEDMIDISPDEDDITGDILSGGLDKHIQKFSSILNDLTHSLGRAPRDLAEVLTDMAIGSFAVCAYRSNGGEPIMASELAKVFINRFNATEATAAVMMAYAEDVSAEGDGHWRNVLRYCCDGGFGAMLDEYVHLMSDGVGFGLEDDKNQRIHESMKDALKIHSANYTVDTYNGFQNRMNNIGYKRTTMRSHYAVGFTNEGVESKTLGRKDSIRNAFNSPLRPFVLATTSIGQEGLDFHNYCRKIMHWNLPSNPIDLEQREGRINRYKCLAIRQDLAVRFGDRAFVDDVWKELFDVASKELRKEKQSELIPYWCVGEDQSVKIERIIPMYPFSKDENNYQRLIKILSVYRLTLGQARQEELVQYLLDGGFGDSEYKQELFINLSPYSRTSDEWKTKIHLREPVVVEKRKTERQIRIEELRAAIRINKKQKKELLEERDSIPVYDPIGMKVVHKPPQENAENKVGAVIKVEDTLVYVKFEDKTMRFGYPESFVEGILVSETYADFSESIGRRETILEKIAAITKELNEQKNELNRLLI